MKSHSSYIFLLALLYLPGISLNAQSIYDQEFTNMAGKKVKLEACKGRKLLVVTLSGNEADTAILSQLSFFQNKYQDKAVIIGVADIEDGYTEGNKKRLNQLGDKYSKSFFLTEGMYVKKTSGSNQSALMKWLTDTNGNQHFNQDVKGVGHKFFLDELGRLYSVIGTEISLQSPVIDKVMNRSPAK
jgi:glutathione peroxidase